MNFKEVSLSSNVFDDIANKVRKNYKNACILYIDELNNDNLLANYLTKKEELETLRGKDKIKELQLFHGTKYDFINAIATNGFQKECNVNSAYGKGNYFSPNASMSQYYTNQDRSEISYMFLCNVLIGNCVEIYGSKEIDTKLYDNSVNSLLGPTIYVSPYNDAIFPRYLIAFHKNTY
jgi:hypothetical protein